MKNNEMINLVDICNSKLARVRLVADMLCLDFEKDGVTSSLHIQCFYRIHKNSEVLVTSQDYHVFDYDKGDEDGKENTLWKNMSKISNQIEGNYITKVSLNDLKDINIQLSNDFHIDVLISNSMSSFEDMIEQYRFLPSEKENDHTVIFI